MEPFNRYGALWKAGTDDLTPEMFAIRKGGNWKNSKGEDCGNGLPFHFERMRNILWPHLDSHRWHVLCRDEIIKNKITVLMGPGSCGKTHEAAWLFLCEYYVFPTETCVLVSSTDLRGLELRVWGEIKSLHEQAQAQFDYIPGHLIDSKHAISTDDIEEDGVRDLRKGIIGIPCIQGGKFVGIKNYCGIKQKRMRLVADEAALMGASFLSSFANLDKNVDFKAVVLGNPNDPLDPLGRAAEPVDGWTSHLEPDKTSVWKTRFMNGTCVNLIGTDSPNFDFPADQPTRYPYLISREKIANTLSFFPKDSVEYYSQCIGAMKVGLLSRRVITRDLCQKFGAMGQVNWEAGVTKIGGLDAAYGGDRCVCGHIEFGREVGGKIVLAFYPPVIVPVRVKENSIPEDQISEFVKEYCERQNIPPENFFHDSTGRGSLGTALARAWSAMTNPVEFGGKPTDRPVSLDLFIRDPKTGQKRLKMCSEHYSKFVTELWFSVRYAIESSQIRRLPEDVMDEGCMREWNFVKDQKIEIETKQEMKERVGRSPDFFDWAVICVEGARRKGFQIAKCGNQEAESKSLQWLEDLKRKQSELQKGRQLVYG